MKFGGKCAYSGTELEPNWQCDHMESIAVNNWLVYKGCSDEKDINSANNLMPSQKIINHYKRGFGLEGFRKYMKDFHIRLSKLPKNPYVIKSIKRKAYMLEIARLFDITITKPFSGKFYFETLN